MKFAGPVEAVNLVNSALALQSPSPTEADTGRLAVTSGIEVE